MLFHFAAQTGIRVMNNIQVIMFPELYSKEQCDKIRKRVPLDVLCTKEYKERQMCLVKFKRYSLKNQ